VMPPVPTDVRSLQVTGFQNTAFKDDVTSSVGKGSDPEQQPTESKEDMANKLSNLKAFWEGENRLIFTRDQAMNDKTWKTLAEDTPHDAGSVVEDPSPRTDLTRHYGTAQSDDETFSPETESSNNLLLDLPKEDGTYRANPIVINDETDESVAGSVQDFLENSPASHETCSPVLPQDQSSPQEDNPTKITDLKGFWDNSRPKIIVSKAEDLFVPDRNKKPDTKPMIGKGFVTKSLGKLQSSKLNPESEFSLSHERPLSPIRPQSPQSRDSSDDELRRSPSKTCHPKVLVRESSLPRRSGVEGSPLKTFPIDIALEHKERKEEGERSTPVPWQRTDPSHEAKLTGSTSVPSEETISRSLPLPPEDCEEQTPPGSGTPTPLARSFVPDDYQHYLGSPEKAHLPPFDEEESVLDAMSKPRHPLRRQGATDGEAMIEGNHCRIRSWIAQNAGSTSNQDKTTIARCESRASSGSELFKLLYSIPLVVT